MTQNSFYLREELATAWAGKSIFKLLAALDGEIFRDKEGRRTLRFSLNGRSYFLKYHQGVGCNEILKNLIQGRLPILGARNEWQAIQFLEKHNIETMTLAGYGETGRNPATRQSFVITDELTETMSLEFVGEQWQKMPPSFATKQALINKLADITRTMHQHGMNHRDYYLCHFLLDDNFAMHNTFTADTPLHVIDLHRALQHANLPQRWRVKDLGSLLFSASRVPMTQRDKFRFMCRYSGLPLKQVLTEQAELWQQVEQRSQRLLAE